MSIIGERKNWDNVFLRDLTVAVLAELEEKIRWKNRFDDKTIDVDCKIYYSLTGSEDFLLDSFTDDIPGEDRFVELNTDEYPRGHITLESWRTKGDEFANPNVWLRTVTENHEEIRNVIAKVRALPISAQYTLNVLVNSEIDTFKASQAIMDSLWAFKYLYFEHNFMNIDAVIKVPDDKSVEITREHNLSSQSEIKLSIQFEVDTYYPAYNENQVLDKPMGVLWGNQINPTDQGKLFGKELDAQLTKSEVSYLNDNETFVIVNLNRASRLTIKIFDSMANQVIKKDFDERIDSGETSLKLDLSNKDLFIPGVYYIKVEADQIYNTLRLNIDN